MFITLKARAISGSRKGAERCRRIARKGQHIHEHWDSAMYSNRIKKKKIVKNIFKFDENRVKLKKKFFKEQIFVIRYSTNLII